MRRIGIMSLMLITMCVGSKAQRLHLFSDSIRNMVDRNTGVVMDFAERYFGELRSLKGTSVEIKQSLDASTTAQCFALGKAMAEALKQ